MGFDILVRVRRVEPGFFHTFDQSRQLGPKPLHLFFELWELLEGGELALALPVGDGRSAEHEKPWFDRIGDTRFGTDGHIVANVDVSDDTRLTGHGHTPADRDGACNAYLGDEHAVRPDL